MDRTSEESNECPREPLPEPSGPLWKAPAAPPHGEAGNGNLPEVAPGARYGLPALDQSYFGDWE